MNRRKFLSTSATVALAFGSRVGLAKSQSLHGGRRVSESFNGGRTQIQSTVPNFSGDFPFINLVKGGDIWRGTSSDNAGAALDPSWLDTNGYPLANCLARDPYGVGMQMRLPSRSSRVSNASNPMVLTWVGNAVVQPTNAPLTGGLNRTSTSAVRNGYGFKDGRYHGRYEWYPTYDSKGDFNFILNLQSIAKGSYCDDIQLFFSDDESALRAGEIFGTKYKSVLQQANAGVFRFMDWLLTNISTTTTWASRKSLNCPAWSADEFRASLYPGNVMTNSGNNYSIVNPSFTLADKLTMHVRFNEDGKFSVNTQRGFGISGSPGTLTTSLSPALTIGWASHGLANGQVLGMIFSGNAPTGMHTGVNYYVVNSTTNTFQLSIAPSGPPIAPANISGGLLGIVTMSTLSLNGSAGISIRGRGGSPMLEAVASVDAGGKIIYGTVVYDAVLGSWLLTGATKSTFSAGLQNGIPVEVCLQLCKELGMHPYFSVPAFALDPMTDYVTSLASYVRANGSPWMVPRFEAGNEVWNTLTPITQYASAKAWKYWRSDWNDWYGMVTSTMGQALANIYGHGNLGTTYEVLVGVQTDGMKYPVPRRSPIDARMTAGQYVANGPAQAGYAHSAANGWASAVLVSNYISPGMRGKYQEWEAAWDWYDNPTNDPARQAADLNAYVDTLAGVNTGFTIPYNVDRWRGSKDWASRFGINKMFAYEGGYSPDLMPTYYDLQFPTQSAMQSNPIGRTSRPPTNATQAVIDIRQVFTAERGISQAQQSGNPARPGMLVYLAGANGMSQLNCNNGFPIFRSGSADVAWPAHNLNVNQVVQFSGSNLPSNIIAGQRYFVISSNLTTNTFEFSAARGGAPIVPNASASSGVTVFSAFVVVSISSVSPNLTTIDVNTSSYPKATSAPYVNFPNSLTIINNFRIATLLHATNLQSLMIQSYSSFKDQGGLFPSQFEVSGTGAIWPSIQPDIYSAQSAEFAAIVTYNH